MAASTTLMTFMVRTPPTTRSVALYGSWDNFTTPYAMSRDVRLGPEHWSGCHSFENIICDGKPEAHAFSRNGGLKMGGTYWYYYKLDDEIEFHNSAEPATTRCPLLPGQIVNELDVPVVLYGRRTRDASISSTSSERRTLDPEAKFMNPRPAPVPTRAIRLNTSPTLLQEPLEQNPTVLQPASAAPLLQTKKFNDNEWAVPSRIFPLPRKPSLDALLKICSSKGGPSGVRSSHRVGDTVTPTQRNHKYQEIINWIPERQSTRQDHSIEPPGSTLLFDPSPPKRPRGALLLRANSEEKVPMSSFKEHRRQHSRSRSRDASQRASITREETADLDLSTARGAEQGVLSAVIEINTPECTPGHGPNTARRLTLEALEGRSEEKDDTEWLQKRLPTLPNTPSSAYPQTHHGDSPLLTEINIIAEMGSRFSATTIDTTCLLDGVVHSDDFDRYLQVANSDTNQSPRTDTMIEDGLPDQIGADQLTYNPHGMSSALSSTTIGSSVSTTPTTIYDESVPSHNNCSSYATSIRSSGESIGNYQHYSLPEIEHASEVTLKRYDTTTCTVVGDDKARTDRHESVLSHSDGMQQLLDELSYLSDMIQQR